MENAEDDTLKRELRDMFYASKDKLSYYDFFNFMEYKLNIQMKGFEKDALESRLDRLSMAFIEFNEMNEFAQEYEINFFDETLIENDLE